MVGSLVGGVVFVEPYLTAPDYLIAISENETRVIIGVFLELINGIAVLGIGVFMFLILKQYDEHTALGYLGLRIIEAVFCCVIVISPLSLTTLSQEYVKAGALDASYYQAAGALSIAERASVTGLLIPPIPSILLSGMMFPYNMLPDVVGKIAQLLPATRAMNAFNGLAMSGVADFYPWGSVIALFASGVLAFGLAVYLFSWDRHNTARRGHPSLALLVLLPYVIGLLFA